MKGLFLVKHNKAEFRKVEKPKIKNPTDVIIKISLTTICGSDIHLIDGIIPSTPGYVLGHEYVGLIEEVGDEVKNFKKGDRVIGPPAPYCGKCHHCKIGFSSHCLNGAVHGSGIERGNLSGSHAEYIRVPYADSCLLAVPSELTDEQVIFISDILSTGYASLLNSNFKKGETLVVFGAGPVGLCTIACAKLLNAGMIIVVGRKDKFRLNTAKKLGATHIIHASEEEVLSKINIITEGRGANVAVDAAGSQTTIEQAVRCVGIGGRVSLAGIVGTPITLPINEVFFKNISINMGLGSLNYKAELMKYIQEGKIDLSALITHRMSLDDIEMALDIFKERTEDVIKIMVKP
ncbi:MAG: alcohol dehydrogenase catalytic domain-containing protein [Lutisporaceae bacterium]